MYIRFTQLVPGCVPEEVHGMHEDDDDRIGRQSRERGISSFRSGFAFGPRRGKPRRSKSVKNVLRGFRGGLLRSTETFGSVCVCWGVSFNK